MQSPPDHLHLTYSLSKLSSRDRKTVIISTLIYNWLACNTAKGIRVRAYCSHTPALILLAAKEISGLRGLVSLWK